MNDTQGQMWASIRSQRKLEEIRRAKEAREMISYYTSELKKWKKRLEVAEDELRNLGCSEKNLKIGR